MDECQQLKNAIESLEAQRHILGNDTVERMVSMARERVATLEMTSSGKQRKQVTVLFADLVDFTPLVAQRDPEEVQEILSIYFRYWRDAITRFGGTVEKFIGDAIMAVYGGRISTEKDPEHAILTALHMQEMRNALNREIHRKYDIDLSFRVGITTGTVIIGDHDGDQNISIAGETVNLASRLQSCAPENAVVIADVTRRLVENRISVIDLGSKHLKGMTEPVEVYLVIGCSSECGNPSEFSERKDAARMVGREDEMERLQSIRETVFSSSTGMLVTIAGEAGVGKSRLLREFVKGFSDGRIDHTLLHGRAVNESQYRPFSLFRNMFESELAIPNDESSDKARQRFEEGIINRFDQPETGIPCAHIVGQLLGFDFSDSPHVEAALEDPLTFRDHGTERIIEYLNTISESKPLLIILEDLHWTDNSSLDTITRIILALKHKPLLILVATRPDLYERRPRWRTERPFHTHIDLHPLGDTTCSLLIGELLHHTPSIPEELIERLAHLTGGNPFYIEEIVKMLQEDGVIVATGDNDVRFRIHSDRLSKIRIPPTLTGVLQARLDGLNKRERLASQYASVVGRTFWDDVIAHIDRSMGLNEVSPASEILSNLEEHEIVFRHNLSSFESIGEYIFKHALFRDVAYESILKRHRRMYHSHVADWFILHQADRISEHSAIIADHLENAGRDDEARRMFIRAGDQATARYAHTEAILFFSRALEKTPDSSLSERFELLQKREASEEILGKREDQEKDLKEMGKLAKTLDATDILPCHSRLAHVMNRMQKLAFDRGDFDSALGLAEKSISLGQTSDDLEAIAAGYSSMGRMLQMKGDLDGAGNAYEQALELAKQSGDSGAQADSYVYLGLLAIYRGNREKSYAYLIESLNLYTRIHHRRGEARVLNLMGTILGDKGDFDAAMSRFEEALEIAREIGDRDLEASLVMNLGIGYDWAGMYDKSMSLYEECRYIADLLDSPGHEACYRLNYGLLLIHTCDFDQAVSELKRSMVIFEEMGSQRDMADSYAAIGRAYFHMNRSQEAREALERSLEIRNKTGEEHTIPTIKAFLAYVDMIEGKLDDAVKKIDDIFPQFEKGALPHSEEPSPLPQYWATYTVLRKVDDPRYEVIIRKAHKLLQDFAAGITSDRIRKSYLSNVPVNREIQKAYTTLSVPTKE